MTKLFIVVDKYLIMINPLEPLNLKITFFLLYFDKIRNRDTITLCDTKLRAEINKNC